MQKKILLLVAVVVLILGGGWYIFSAGSTTKAPTPAQPSQQISIPSSQTVDYQAAFAIFTNGTFRKFSDPKYHNLSENVYIEADNPNIIKVKKTGIKWGDFFKTLPMKLTKECLTTGTGQLFCTGSQGSLKFYLNGKVEPDLLDIEIQNEDRALITFGSEDEQQINLQFEKVPHP
ncbi:hypothetical protein HYS94_00460 [Candidatus Daviesbacteria bacterium]|nr:hypothetical protein [Candidatus Daviesbacteria bacterium]